MGTTTEVEGNRRARQEWVFFTSLHKADRPLAVAWWSLLVLRGVLPAAMAVTMGVLIGAVERGDDLAVPLTAMGIVFIALQVLNPIHAAVSADLGDRTAAWLYDQLTETCLAPPGIGHLEDPDLADDLQLARDFDRGMTGPPLRMSMDFIADGLALLLMGLVSAALLVGFAWWARLLWGGAWGAAPWNGRQPSASSTPHSRRWTAPSEPSRAKDRPSGLYCTAAERAIPAWISLTTAPSFWNR